MKINNIFSKGISVIAGAVLLLAITACARSTSQVSDNCAQVAGTWIAEQVIDNTQCGGPINTINYLVTVS